MKEPVIRKGWAGVVVFSMLSGFFVFLVSAGILNYHYSVFAWDFWILTGVVAFGVSVAVLRPKKQVISNAVQNRLAVIGIVKEREKMVDGKLMGREIVRLPVYPRYVDLEDDVLSLKGHNRNIAISGMARSGKTYLMYWLLSQLSTFQLENGKIIPLNRIVFQAKDSDRFGELGIETLFLKKFVPNVFQDPNAFIMSWKLAFSLNNMGITALRIEPKLLEIVKKLKENPSWEEFNKELERMLSAERSNITQEALATIQNVFRAVAYEDNTETYREMANIELPKSIVLNFAGLNNFAFVFFAEYLLRQLDTEIENREREGTSIMVDEAHLFNSIGSILPRISAVIASRGSLIVATQELHTIEGQLKGNCATQFCYKQTEPKDLNVASALSEPYHWMVQRLYPYEFIDLAQHDSHNGIYIYRLINPKPNFTEIKEWKPKGAEENEEDHESKGSPDIEITKEIIRLLSMPANQQDLAKRFVKEYGKDVNYWKMTLKTYVKKMYLQGEISATETSYVKFVQDKPYSIVKSLIYHRVGDYSYHDWLVNITADILFHKKYTPLVQAHGLSLPDIIVDNPKIAVEIETGTKQGYKVSETQDRIDGLVKEGYKVYVIVPNDEVRGKYKGFPNVMTALELFKEVNR